MKKKTNKKLLKVIKQEPAKICSSSNNNSSSNLCKIGKREPNPQENQEFKNNLFVNNKNPCTTMFNREPTNKRVKTHKFKSNLRHNNIKIYNNNM